MKIYWAQTPSFSVFTWKLSKFRQYEHTRGVVTHYLLLPVSSHNYYTTEPTASGRHRKAFINLQLCLTESSWVHLILLVHLISNRKIGKTRLVAKSNVSILGFDFCEFPTLTVLPLLFLCTDLILKIILKIY